LGNGIAGDGSRISAGIAETEAFAEDGLTSSSQTNIFVSSYGANYRSDVGEYKAFAQHAMRKRASVLLLCIECLLNCLVRQPDLLKADH
jgi:hypothetical protein